MTTLTEKAVPGRRILLDHASLKKQVPGVILTFPNASGLTEIRLDGRRHRLPVPAASERITYLDEVVDVPDLPMGRFHPTAKDFGGQWDGIPVGMFEDDAIAVLSPDRQVALAALTAYCGDTGYDLEFMDFTPLEARWVVFEWQPEDADPEWLMNFAEEGDDMAILIHHLPA